jgi:hypothetical protein
MQRNRESAMQSRQRKKMQMDELERRNKELETQNAHLTGAFYWHLFLKCCIHQCIAMVSLHLTT